MNEKELIEELKKQFIRIINHPRSTNATSGISRTAIQMIDKFYEPEPKPVRIISPGFKPKEVE